MPKKYVVHLSNEEQENLENVVSKGGANVRQRTDRIVETGLTLW
jgi:hypothetical protein